MCQWKTFILLYAIASWQPKVVFLLHLNTCLLYTSDAADDSLRVDLGGRRIIKKNNF